MAEPQKPSTGPIVSAATVPRPSALVNRGAHLVERFQRIRDTHSEGFSYLSVVRDFETKGALNQERVWRIMVDVTQLVCGEATDGFGWSCV